MDKFEYYNKIKNILNNAEYSVEEYKEINFGLQFSIIVQSEKCLLRIYEGKKGVRLDLSQIKSTVLRSQIESIVSEKPEDLVAQKLVENSNKRSKVAVSDIDLSSMDELIGTDESGKGDYFGPLVIAGVYVDKVLSKELKLLGVADSKKLQDSTIERYAIEIKKRCKYSVVVIGNKKYNELYRKIDNLNEILAWGHARCIENILSEVTAKVALSDQFGDKKLIENALMKNGKLVELKQAPRAEQNIAVAAASVLARAEFVNRLKWMSSKYRLNFPKGASGKVVEAGLKYVQKVGQSRLGEVAKLHFKTTNAIISCSK